MMRRRDFITLLGGVAAVWPWVARGQFKPALIGVLGSGSAQSSAFLIGALKEGMKDNGLTEGRDYVLDVRWAEGDYTPVLKPAGPGGSCPHGYTSSSSYCVPARAPR